MCLYFVLLLVFMPLYGMEEHLKSQDPNKCPLVKLPMSTMAHILSYVIAPTCTDGFYLGKTRRARKFLNTCKYYYTSKELTQGITGLFVREYNELRAFIFVPLYLSSPTALTCLREWLQTTSEVKIHGITHPLLSSEKVSSLDALLIEASRGLINPNGSAYTATQREHLINQFKILKSLAQQIA
jgi:hypothetical protein